MGQGRGLISVVPAIKTKRKTRSDKKRDIRPTILIELKNSIYRLSVITATPVKDICELLVLYGIYKNKEIIKSLSGNFQRGVQIDHTFYEGGLGNEKISKRDEGESERITVRVRNELYAELHSLAFALDCSVSRAVAILLYEGITDGEFIEKYIEDYVATLSESKKKELKKLLNYVRAESGETLSMRGLLSYVAEVPLKWIMPND